jgi:hypothetical protein
MVDQQLAIGDWRSTAAFVSMPTTVRMLVFMTALTALLGERTTGAARREPQASARARVSGQAKIGLPVFGDYPSREAFTGRVARVRLDSALYGRNYRTRLRDGARKGPNFVGAFTVVLWGCGSSCQVAVVVNANTGALSRQILRTTNGVEYRRESRLLIADPVRPGDPPLDTCAACGVPAAYAWTGARFEPVGSGPHPHLARAAAVAPERVTRSGRRLPSDK